MSDLARDVRLAVDTGKVALGSREVDRAVLRNTAKVVIAAERARKDKLDDIIHMCAVANIRLLKFDATSNGLGTVCGKPYPVVAVAIIEPGNSNIINEKY
jgi:large subunit ribosomal protein L30e